MYSLYANVIAGGVLIGIVYALIALGLTIMFGVMRVVNFAHGELVVLGMMGMRFSIEIIIAPIIGGMGTLFGPIIGAFFVIPINEISNHAAQSMGIFGLNTLIYGVLILMVIVFLPDGIWPPVAKRIERWMKGGASS